MPFPFSIFICSYAIWQASIERAFELNPFEVRYARSEDV
jgi:hypothetical protein